MYFHCEHCEMLLLLVRLGAFYPHELEPAIDLRRTLDLFPTTSVPTRTGTIECTHLRCSLFRSIDSSPRFVLLQPLPRLPCSRRHLSYSPTPNPMRSSPSSRDDRRSSLPMLKGGHELDRVALEFEAPYSVLFCTSGDVGRKTVEGVEVDDSGFASEVERGCEGCGSWREEGISIGVRGE